MLSMVPVPAIPDSRPAALVPAVAPVATARPVHRIEAEPHAARVRTIAVEPAERRHAPPRFGVGTLVDTFA